ncbi:MAG: recombinase family protein [Firmicutes bacterium]|nr:recombinase family protein [Bacillota bacterium]
MQQPQTDRKEKVVHVINPTISAQENANNRYKQQRVVAYCRVSTKQEEQLNSYETQVNYYTEKIRSEPKWTLAGIFADKGISGTSIKNREEFNKMIRLCKRGKIDLIITKSISRFARNTLDCLKYTRMLKELGVDVYFEEQGIHSIKPGAEFYISIYGSIAQSESENISANVKFGKAQSAKEGNAPFHYTKFLGYKKGTDGNPEIVPEEAETVKMIYDNFISGDSLSRIAEKLQQADKPTPCGKRKWSSSTVRSILSNEKYAGDVITNKTYTEDCISKKVKVNNGERRKYYIENHHLAIIEKEMFARVQEELAKRKSKSKVKQIGTKTSSGKYSSMYALTELLICGECHTPYRRCTWTSRGKKKIVWRCINRLDYGKKYCHHSPTIEERVMHEGVINAITTAANQNAELLKILQRHIAAEIDIENISSERMEIQIKIAKIEETFKNMLNAVSSDNADEFDEKQAKKLIEEKTSLEKELANLAETEQKGEDAKKRVEDIVMVMDGLKNHPLKYEDKLVRQVIEYIVVESKEKIKVVFKGGFEIEQSLY